jgi:hypothetical protein
MGKPRGRWEDDVWRDDVDLLEIRNWKAGARKEESWSKEIGESMSRKGGLAPQKKAYGPVNVT